LRPWIVPMRRLTWLRTTLFMARWRVETREPRDPANTTQWSDARLDPKMKRHIDARIDECFERDTIQNIRAEWLTCLVPDLFSKSPRHEEQRRAPLSRRSGARARAQGPRCFVERVESLRRREEDSHQRRLGHRRRAAAAAHHADARRHAHHHGTQ